jgi:murein DD-endopeptidase MepM/ murein hydrolase activator NlpD
MTQRSFEEFKANNSEKSTKTADYHRLLKQRAAIVGGLGILGGGLAAIPATATPNTFVVPDIAAPAPAPTKVVKPVVRTNVRSTPTRTNTTPKTSVAPQPIRLSPRPSTTPKTQLSSPKVSSQNSPSQKAPTGIENLVRQPQSNVSSSVEQGKNTYIDPTSYNRNNTANYSAPSAVILSDRKGCTNISQKGKLTQSSCGTTVRRQSAASIKPRVTRPSIVQASRPTTTRTKAINSVKPPSNIALVPIPKYNRATQNYYYPQTIPQNSKTALMYPLPIVAKITSAFGLRVHPVLKTSRMHSGTDLGAPMGTPVLAAYDGEVALADKLGGYGMTVILRHVQGTQESLYGHLSEIFVKQGEKIKQGTVIGRVGSTGVSTGPHLHFEWRHLTTEGWVAVDAGLHLEYALDNLMQSMQMADSDTKPQG